MSDDGMFCPYKKSTKREVSYSWTSRTEITTERFGWCSEKKCMAYNTGYSEAEAQRASTPAPGKTLPQLLEQLNAGECKGIKSATAYKIEEFARQQGYLE